MKISSSCSITRSATCARDEQVRVQSYLASITSVSLREGQQPLAREPLYCDTRET